MLLPAHRTHRCGVHLLVSQIDVACHDYNNLWVWAGLLAACHDAPRQLLRWQRGVAREAIAAGASSGGLTQSEMRAHLKAAPNHAKRRGCVVLEHLQRVAQGQACDHGG